MTYPHPRDAFGVVTIMFDLILIEWHDAAEIPHIKGELPEPGSSAGLSPTQVITEDEEAVLSPFSPVSSRSSDHFFELISILVNTKSSNNISEMQSFTASRNATFSESTETVVFQPEPKQWYTFGCIPSRWAFLVLAVLLTMTSLTSLLMGSILYNKLCRSCQPVNFQLLTESTDSGVTEFQRVAIIMHIFVYTVLVFFCGFGYVRLYVST
jgi:hypothetical protein